MDKRITPPGVPVEACEIFGNLPDGSYEARVENAGYRLSKSGNPMVVYEFVITKGFFAKRHVWKYDVVREGSRERILGDALRLGVAAADIKELIDKLPSAKGAAARITLKSSMYSGKKSQFVSIGDDRARGADSGQAQ